MCVLVALLGTPHGYAATHAVFGHARWAVIAAALVGAVAALRMTPRATACAQASAAATAAAGATALEAAS